MKRQLIELFGFIFLLCFFSCASSDRKNDSTIQNTSVIDNAVKDTSSTIVAKLPPNSTVALFNNSSDENELTNYVIEELHSTLTNKSNLKIVERDRLENLEKEHKFQMTTGYVPDEEITSIVKKLGAQYVVSCYITGNGNLQRLRIKTWNLETGETIASNVFPTNEMGVQLVKNVEEAKKTPLPKDTVNSFFTIRENGITVDYRMITRDLSWDSSDGIVKYAQKLIGYDVYIDSTKYYFAITLEKSIENKNNKTNIVCSSEFKSASGKYKAFVDPNFESQIVSFLTSEGVDRRNANFISRILMRILNT